MIGKTLALGWDGANNVLCDDYPAYSHVRVESFGSDWIIVRHIVTGKAYAATFDKPMSIEDMIEELEK